MSAPTGQQLAALEAAAAAQARMQNARGATAAAQGAPPLSAETRTFRGRSLDELIPLIQRELGGDAIILRRREGLTGGFLGFFQHQFVELEAIGGAPRLDLYDEEESALPPSLAASPPPAPPPARAPAVARRPEPREPSTPFYPPAPSTPAEDGSAYVTAHLAALAKADRSTVPQHSWIPDPIRETPAQSLGFQELIPRERQPPRAGARGAPELTARPRQPTQERRTVAAGSRSQARTGVEKTLRRVGVSEELARELIEGATAHALALAPSAGLAQAVRMTLAQRIPVAPALPAQGAAIVLVGAGGAGKTTCCATLLGAYRKNSTLPASFATLTRGSERGDLQMLLSPQLMKPTAATSARALKALRTARADGLAVLDTPRLSPADRTGIRELARLLGELAPERVVVALPATLGAAAAAQLLQALAPLGANALAVTHGDETDQIGVAVEAACRFGLAPEYLLDRGRSGGWRLSRIDPTALAGRLLP
jgi:flagellar biosynthesis GTPase FlhF